MSELVDLWSRSFELVGAEDSQRYVNLHFEAACRRAGMAFWKSSERPPGLALKTLFLGIAPYDLNDLKLLDGLQPRGWVLSGQFETVVVFSLADEFSLADIQGVVPDANSFAGCNPFVSVWSEGRCSFSVAGHRARRWLEAIPPPRD